MGLEVRSQNSKFKVPTSRAKAREKWGTRVGGVLHDLAACACAFSDCGDASVGLVRDSAVEGEHGSAKEGQVLLEDHRGLVDVCDCGGLHGRSVYGFDYSDGGGRDFLA